jgi:hypothetical protein
LFAIAVIVLLPGPAGRFTVNENVPDVLANPTPSSELPLPVSVTMLPGVAVPEITCVTVAVPDTSEELRATTGDKICTVGGAVAVNVTGTDVLPPALLAVMVSVLGPAGTVTEQANVPDTEAVVLHSVTGPGPVITTRLPGVAVPETVGVSVVCGPTGFARSVGTATAVKLLTAGVDTPPALVDTAVTLAGPAGKVSTGAVQTPVGLAVSVVLLPLLAVNTTVLFGVAVPDMVGDSVVSVLLTGVLIATVGAATTVNVMGCELLPPGPDAVTVSVFGPVGSGDVSAQAKVPDAEAVVLHNVTGPGPVITTVLPGVAVPEIVGVVVVEVLFGDETVRLAGAMAVNVATDGDDVPPVFWASAVTEAGPAANVRLPTGAVQTPVALAVTTTGVLPAAETVTEANGVAVPDTVGLSVAVPLLAGDRIATVGGPTAVNVTGSEVTPPGFDADTTSVLGPAGSGEVSAQAYVPETGSAVVLHSTVLPGPRITTLLPGVAVPAIVGVVVVDTLLGEVTASVGGAMAVKLSMAGADTPPTFWAMAVIEAGPAVNVRLLTGAVQTPNALAVTTTGVLPTADTVTEASGVAVPETTGASVAVLLIAGETIATVGGAMAVIVSGTDVVPPMPDAVTVSVFGPTDTLTGQANVPDTEAVVLHSVTGPGPVIVTSAPGVAVPDTTGAVLVCGVDTTVRLGGPTMVSVI